MKTTNIMIRKLVVNEFTTFHLSLHYLKNVMKTPYVHVNDLINSTRNPVFIYRCYKIDDRFLNVGDCQRIDPCNPYPCSQKDMECVPTRKVCLSPWNTCQQYKCKVRELGRKFPLDTKCQHTVKVMTFHPAFTCSKLTIETLEQGVKYVQS